MGAEELAESAGEIATLTKNAAAVDMPYGGLKLHALEMRLVAEVFGCFEGGLAVVLVGGVVVLTYLGVGAALAPRFGGLRLRRDRAENHEPRHKKEEWECLEEVCR